MLDQAGLTQLRAALRALDGAASAVVPRALAPLADLSAQGLHLSIDMAASAALGAPLVIARAGGLDLGALTPRQREVAGQVAVGPPNKEIARNLGLSLGTVKDHVHVILTRLRLPRRAALIAAMTTP